MVKFSERNGYTDVSNIIIREEITPAILNGIMNWLDVLKGNREGIGVNWYKYMDMFIWENHFNKRTAQYAYSNQNSYSIDKFIESEQNWYDILDLLEELIRLLNQLPESDWRYKKCLESLNNLFARHNFAYRVVNGFFEEITSKEEIESIAEALDTQVSGVKTHLNEALKLLSVSNETPSYRNSIKESISAVEAFVEMITGEKLLGKSLSALKKKGIILPANLVEGARKLYDYTNDNTTGIRHTSGDITNPPTADEAIYMLVVCSAFINYLKKKI